MKERGEPGREEEAASQWGGAQVALESDDSSNSKQKPDRKETTKANNFGPGEGPAPLVSVPFAARPQTPSSPQPLTDGPSFRVTDPVKAREVRPLGLQKEAVQKEDPAAQEPQWRYQPPMPGP